jgi:Ca2+/H+ antiporter, TMEM165/GDT1 family
VITPSSPESQINPALPLVIAATISSVDTPVEPLRQQNSGVWSTFLSTFITIFLAEMGDKTQLATLLMTAQSQSPWIVFLGSGLALIATSLVGVLLGRYLSKVLSPRTLDIAAGVLLLVISILLLGDVVAL